MIEMVRLDSGQRSLHTIEDIANDRFSIIECVADQFSSEASLKEGSTCTLVSQTWIPGSPEFRQSFDRAYSEAVREENVRLNKKYRWKDVFWAAAAAPMAAGTAYMMLDIYAVERAKRAGVPTYQLTGISAESTFPRAFVIATTVAVGLIAVAVLLNYTSRHPTVSIEQTVMAKDPKKLPTEVAAVSAEIYAGIKRSFESALNFRQSL